MTTSAPWNAEAVSVHGPPAAAAAHLLWDHFELCCLEALRFLGGPVVPLFLGVSLCPH